jgi:hypothetical protein
MKKLICILASAALFGACEEKTDVVAPAASPVPEKTNKAVDPNTFSKRPTLTSETKTDTTTTTASSPTP